MSNIRIVVNLKRNHASTVADSSLDSTIPSTTNAYKPTTISITIKEQGQTRSRSRQRVEVRTDSRNNVNIRSYEINPTRPHHNVSTSQSNVSTEFHDIPMPSNMQDSFEQSRVSLDEGGSTPPRFKATSTPNGSIAKTNKCYKKIKTQPSDPSTDAVHTISSQSNDGETCRNNCTDNESSESSTRISEVQICALCNVETTDYNFHLMNKHLVDKWTYDCEYCSKEFNREWHLRLHHDSKHPDSRLDEQMINWYSNENKELAKVLLNQISQPWPFKLPPNKHVYRYIKYQSGSDKSSPDDEYIKMDKKTMCTSGVKFRAHKNWRPVLKKEESDQEVPDAPQPDSQLETKSMKEVQS